MGGKEGGGFGSSVIPSSFVTLSLQGEFVSLDSALNHAQGIVLMLTRASRSVW